MFNHSFLLLGHVLSEEQYKCEDPYSWFICSKLDCCHDLLESYQSRDILFWYLRTVGLFIVNVILILILSVKSSFVF